MENDGEMGQTMAETRLNPTIEVINSDELLARCMGSVDLASHVLAKFLDRVPEDLDQLEKDLVASDRDAIIDMAHRIKGASASVAAPQLHEWAAEIERLGRDNRMAEIPSGIRQLRDEWSRFTKSVETLEWNQPNVS